MCSASSANAKFEKVENGSTGPEAELEWPQKSTRSGTTYLKLSSGLIRFMFVNALMAR